MDTSTAKVSELRGLCDCHDCLKARLLRTIADMERVYGQPEMPFPPHKHVYHSLYGEQNEHFGTLACVCNKMLIYSRIKSENAG